MPKRFNHMELTFPKGALDDATRKDIAAFYGEMFGWTSSEQPASGGSFTRLRQSGRDAGSLYQLSEKHLADGVPSHWTLYIRVDDVDAAAQRAVALGGEIIVQPFEVPDTARIALVLDCVGAHFGLWQPIDANAAGDANG